MNITLQLRYAAEPQRPVAAWRLDGDSPARWLDEVTAWPGEQTAWKLYPLGGNEPGSVAGLLVEPAAGDLAAIAAVHPGGSPYSRIGRLLLPVHARFDPLLSDAEVEALLPADDSLYVWQPQVGLIRCDSTATLSLPQLLAAPSRAAGSWNAAVAGVRTNQRLLSIQPSAALSVEHLMEEARGDISEDAGNWEALPRSPREPRNFPMRLLVRLASLAGLARVGPWRRQTKSARTTATGAGDKPSAVSRWLRGVGERLAEQAARVSSQLQASRNREVERLLHLLQTQPDEGLRYAIPMGGSGAHRGRAAPRGSLIGRDVDFNLRRLVGGAPADVWAIDAEYQVRLWRLYRELANREISLGRHRRAAYIFAELLGDLPAAARTLADGRHFREAAVLYADRLQDPRAAAKCLEQGGLLTEAIPFYQRLHEHEKVAELYERLRQPDSAAVAYRLAIESKLAAEDFLGAARLWEEKLHAPDEALAVLERGWPGSAQARSCLHALFDLLARRAEHERARERLTQLVAGRHETDAALASCLSRLARLYPQTSLRHYAADQARILAARRLAVATESEVAVWLETLRELAPQDRLLARDCERFRGRSSSMATGRPRSVRRIPVIKTFQLPAAEWETAVVIGRQFYAAGWRGDDLVLVRGLWDGTLHQPRGRPWRLARSAARTDRIKGGILLAAGQRRDASLFVHVLHQPRLEGPRLFPITDRFDDCSAGSHPAFDRSLVALHVVTHYALLTVSFEVEADDLRLVLKRFNLYGDELVESTPLPPPPNKGSIQLPLPVITVGDMTLLGLGTQLRGFSSTVGMQEEQILSEGCIREMCVISPRSGQGFALTSSRGGYFWVNKPFNSQPLRFCEELADPLACFTRHGQLVVAAANCLECFDTSRQRLQLIDRLERSGAPPAALLPLPQAGQAALLARDGMMTVYEFRRG